MGLKSKKGQKGEAVEYYSRKQAIRHLQINLPNFIRLCLWKGIYPSEPHCRKIAGRGNTTPKSYYKRKDINLLLHEPVLTKLRDIRIHKLKVRKAKEKKDKDKLFRLMKSKPTYSLCHLVKELYPTREDALANLDDALKNIFIFAVLPKITQFNSTYITLCKKLKLEFFNYCITEQVLRKCFISVKGYYMSADILGVQVTWAMPHQHTATVLPGHVDYRMLANQVEFDCTMLSSLLKNLYNTAGLSYPPKFEMPEKEWTDSDMLASLTCPVVRSTTDHEERVAHLSKFIGMDDNVGPSIEKEERVFAIQTLFKGKKIFLNREVPREVFSFLIRCCGGEVSWDKAVGHAAPFDESDDDINYQVIDRPLSQVDAKLSRFYIQPQFIFDSINAGRLLPVKDYMPGTELPAHLCPFVDYSAGYVPPEYKYLRGEISLEQLYEVQKKDAADEGSDSEAVDEIVYESENEVDDEDMDDDDEEDSDVDMDEEEVEDIGDEKKTSSKRKTTDQVMAEIKMKEMKKQREDKKKTAAVQVKRKPKEQLMAEIAANKEIKMKEMNIPKKQRNLYNKMKFAEKKKVSDVVKMTEKRQEANKKRAAASKK